jgi:dTDP-L-rhamnose 4-epimerase
MALIIGRAYHIPTVALRFFNVYGPRQALSRVTGKYRAGDIRHCFADLALARRKLGYAPQVDFRQGLAEFAAWLKDKVAEDRVDRATAELEARGLVA